MTVKVTGFSTRNLNVSKTFDAKNSRVVLTPALKEYRRRLRRVAEEHYVNHGSQVKRILRNGLPNPASSGSRVIKAVDGEGKGIHFTTGFWPALTGRYRRRTPVSRRMWKKRGVLSRQVAEDMPRGSLKASISQTRSLKLKSTKKRAVAVHTLQFTVPGYRALATFMVRPFVYADPRGPSEASVSGYDRESSDLIAYPEWKGFFVGGKRVQGRPWVAGLSARMGKSMHAALRKL